MGPPGGPTEGDRQRGTDRGGPTARGGPTRGPTFKLNSVAPRQIEVHLVPIDQS